MDQRENLRRVRENRRRLFLETWQKERAGGVSFSAFCRNYGLSRKNFYRWLNKAHRSAKKNPVHPSNLYLKHKVVEIYLRYKGTWSAETISGVLGNRLSPWVIRKIIRPCKSPRHQLSRRIKPVAATPSAPRPPNLAWAVDWTEYKLRRGKIFIILFIDESSRFWLGWEILETTPKTEDLLRCLGHILARYQYRPILLKSDRAKVFLTSRWETLLASHGILPQRGRPRHPKDQAIIERAIRDVKTWLRANQPQTLKEARVCVEEGIFMLNFLKPRGVLMAKTPAAVYLGKPLSFSAHSTLSDPGLPT